MKSNTRERVAKALETLELIGKAGDGRIHFGDIVRLGNARGELREALKEPLMNCEVGTVEEQAQRFNDYCKKQSNGCCIGKSKGTCPIFKGYKIDCGLVWSQTPYEESEATDGSK